MNDHLLFLLGLPRMPQHIVYICMCMSMCILIHIVSYVINEEKKIRRDVFSLHLSLLQALISYLDKKMKYKLMDIDIYVVTDTYRDT